MIASKMTALKPLIESKGGLHLTAYIANDHNILNLKRNIREAINAAYEYLAPVTSSESLVKFVSPMYNLLEDTKVLRNLKGNVGIFRSESSFRVLSLPIPVEKTFVVATSFHVKPLLRWIQADREFLILGLNENSASLYQGNQHNLSLVDMVLFSSTIEHNEDHKFHLSYKEELEQSRQKKIKFNEAIHWVNDWLKTLTTDIRPVLFVAGQKELTDVFLKDCTYKKTRPMPVWPSFEEYRIPEICATARSILKKNAQQDLEKALLEFYLADDLNLVNKNIFQIAKAAIKGRVKKLIIADGINIFGKLDNKSGGVSIHPTHLDHEDDDLLDDLAQEVLSHGGEVIVAPREDIPKGRPILALMDRAGAEASPSINRESLNERKII